MINVSELISDPDFCQPNGIMVIRRKTEVVEHRNINTEEKIKYTGIITIATPKQTQFLPEANRDEEAICVFTYTPLYVTGDEGSNTPPGEGYLSDIVCWNGCRYIAVQCRNNAQYGYCRTIALKQEQE